MIADITLLLGNVEKGHLRLSFVTICLSVLEAEEEQQHEDKDNVMQIHHQHVKVRVTLKLGWYAPGLFNQKGR